MVKQNWTWILDSIALRETFILGTWKSEVTYLPKRTLESKLTFQENALQAEEASTAVGRDTFHRIPLTHTLFFLRFPSLCLFVGGRWLRRDIQATAGWITVLQMLFWRQQSVVLSASSEGSLPVALGQLPNFLTDFSLKCWRLTAPPGRLMVRSESVKCKALGKHQVWDKLYVFSHHIYI